MSFIHPFIQRDSSCVVSFPILNTTTYYYEALIENEEVNADFSLGLRGVRLVCGTADGGTGGTYRT